MGPFFSPSPFTQLNNNGLSLTSEEGFTPCKFANQAILFGRLALILKVFFCLFGRENKKKRLHLKATEKCSRTFITFTDEKVFKDNFPYQRKRAPIKQYCPVTRLPAKYFDPITQTPFANAHAFKVLRDAYEKQLEAETAKTSKRGQ